MTTNQIYHVTTQVDVEGNGRRTIAYATGNPEDIKAFYDDRRTYSIDVEPITFFNVTPQAVQERKALLQEHQTLEARLKEVKTQLGK